MERGGPRAPWRRERAPRSASSSCRTPGADRDGRTPSPSLSRPSVESSDASGAAQGSDASPKAGVLPAAWSATGARQTVLPTRRAGSPCPRTSGPRFRPTARGPAQPARHETLRLRAATSRGHRARARCGFPCGRHWQRNAVCREQYGVRWTFERDWRRGAPRWGEVIGEATWDNLRCQAHRRLQVNCPLPQFAA